MLAHGLMLALVAPALALGQGAATRPTNPESLPIPESSSSPTSGVDAGLGGSLFRLLIGLVVVVAVILGIWFVMKRLQRGRFPGSPLDSELVDVVATTALGPNRFLHLVRVGDELILIGATDHAITPVLRVGSDEEALGALGPDVLGATATPEARAAASVRLDPRERAEQTAGTQNMVERLRAMTTRSQGRR
jgi:flagellar biogenesis protein FliO